MITHFFLNLQQFNQIIIYNYKPKIKMNKLVIALSLSLFFTGALAQKSKKSEIKVESKVTEDPKTGQKKVVTIKEKDGKREVTETILDGSQKEPKVMIFKDDQDSVIVNIDDKPKKHKKVIIKNIDGNTTTSIIEGDSSIVDLSDINTEDISDIRVYRYGKPGSKSKTRSFYFNGDEMSDIIKGKMDIHSDNLGRAFNRSFRFENRDFFDDHNVRRIPSQGLRNLDVYTNQPETYVINVKFYTNLEADIRITVVDAMGNIMAKVEEKKFKGEFMDQIRLPKDSKGTYFVLLAQGDDALSRKVKIGNVKEEEK
jgi:hypothetical protein